MVKKSFVVWISIAIFLLTASVTFAMSSTIEATIASFKVYVNGHEVDSPNEEYPFLVYNDITYLPLTYANKVNLGMDTSFDENSNSLSVRTEGIDILQKNLDSFNKWAANKGIYGVRLTFDDLGNYLSVSYNSENDAQKDAQNIQSIALIAGLVKPKDIYIKLHENNEHIGNYIIDYEKFVKNVKGESSENYIDYQSVKPNTSNITSQIPSTPVVEQNTPSLYSSDGKTYLGKLSTNKYDTESIFNTYGDYGSKYSSTSIWNEYGNYGGKYSDESAFNEYATKPPVIILNGKVIGHLTVNTSFTDAVSPFGLSEFLKDIGY